MKKILIGIIAVLLFSVIFLSGCNGGDSRFSGTWEGGFAEDTIDMGITKLIFTGGNEVTCTVTMRIFEGNYRDVQSFDGTYKLEGNNLIITNPLGGAYILDYRFETKDGKEVLYLNDSKFTKV